MSSTIRTLVTKGLREAAIIEVGGEPEAAEFEEGLDLLQGLYLSLFGNELGEPLEDLNYGTQNLSNSYALNEDVSPVVNSAYIPPNSRLLLNVSGPETLYLPPNPRDGARIAVLDNAGNLSTNNVILNGNGRKIENAATVTLNTDSLNREWFYRADLGTWTKLTDLVAEDLSPLPREFDDFLTTALAMRLNPRYGAQTSQETMTTLARGQRQFRSRYRQVKEVSSEDGIVRIPSNRYWYNTSYNSTTDFNRGL